MCLTYCVVCQLLSTFCAIVQQLLVLMCEIVAIPFRSLYAWLCPKRPDRHSVEHDPLLDRSQVVITVDLSRNHLPTGTETMPVADTTAHTA